MLMISYTAGHAETTKMFPFWEATTVWRSDVAYAECAPHGTCQTSRRGIEELTTMLVNTSLALYRFVAVSLRKRRGRIKERPERWRCEKGRQPRAGCRKTCGEGTNEQRLFEWVVRHPGWTRGGAVPLVDLTGVFGNLGRAK